jgi:NADH dehydrogenase
MHRIIVVGGGAGGLELVTQLGDRLGARRRRPRASISLVDINPTHLWKPLLHEAAAGSIDLSRHQLEYAAQARWHGFTFHQGALTGLNRAAQQITLGPVSDDMGTEFLPQRTLEYDTLILALGSTSHFFNIPGAKENTFPLDTATQAEHFRRRLITACLQAEQGAIPLPLRIAIIGAGATGVELAAELRNTAQVLAAYGLHSLDVHKDIQISIIEAAPRILPALPERMANTTAKLLQKLMIDIKTNEMVTQVDPKRIHLKSGEHIDAELIVWAAGIKAPEVLSTLDNLSVNRQGQLIVNPTLDSIDDPNIFALGDCASCPWLGQAEGKTVPPRAQAAHQQSSFLASAMKRRLANKPLRPFKYRDLGALVSLGHLSAVGTLKGGRANIPVKGWIARILYTSLYRLHIAALHGWICMGLDTIAQWFSRSTKPSVKLH